MERHPTHDEIQPDEPQRQYGIQEDGLDVVFSDANASYEPDHQHFREERAPGTVTYPFIERRHATRRSTDRADELPDPLESLDFHIGEERPGLPDEAVQLGSIPSVHDKIFDEPEIGRDASTNAFPDNL